MNNSPSYEQLIAQKIVQAPVPSLEDSIWSSIEAQLDLPLPGEELKDQSANNPSGKGLPGTGKLLYVAIPALLITAAILIFSKKKKDRKKQNPVPQQVIPQKINQQDSNAALPDIPLPQTQQATVPSQKDTGTIKPVITVPYQDSVFPVQLPVQKTDSIVQTNTPLPAIPDSTLKKTDGKKPKGVKGISDTDYKIKAEHKDTARKKS